MTEKKKPSRKERKFPPTPRGTARLREVGGTSRQLALSIPADQTADVEHLFGSIFVCTVDAKGIHFSLAPMTVAMFLTEVEPEPELEE